MWTFLVAGAAGLFAGTAHSSHGGGLPFFELGHIDLFGLKLQYFGMLVATGVLLGAHLMRRYAEARGCDDDDLRGLIAWIVVSGFIGAHVFDVLAYQTDKLAKDPLLLVKLWIGISSYGGFIGGALGGYFYVWWKRLTPGMWTDATLVGLLPGFTMGRVGCTMVHDHMGRQTDFFLGTAYPYKEMVERGHCRIGAPAADLPFCPEYPGVVPGDVVTIHNLGMYEVLYLLPICALILFLAFGRKKDSPAGLLGVLTVALYAPARFFFEFLRLNESDPRYIGLTFAQWASIAALIAAVLATLTIIKQGKPALRLAALGDAIGGRLDGKPKITAKHLADLKAEEQAEKAKARAEADAAKRGDKPKPAADKPKGGGKAS